MCELFAMSARQPADVRLVKEPTAAADSACLEFIQEHPFRSSLVVGHIRKATQGRLTLANSQPFAHELGGRMHVFAHNGDLEGARLRNSYSLRAYRPVGETDSEYAFCALLEAVARFWRAQDALFVHGHKRAHADGIRPPGLHVLGRTCAGEPWRALGEGETLALREGRIVSPGGLSHD